MSSVKSSSWTIAVLIGLVLCLFTQQAGARGTSRSKRSRVLRYLASDFYQIDFSYSFWREEIEASQNSSTGILASHFEGLQVGASYLKPRRNIRWVHSYWAALSLGRAKGTVSGDFADVVAHQKWISLSLAPGLIYRANFRAEFGVRIPLVYRYTLWDLNANSGVEIDRESSFSYGVTGLFITHLTLKSAITVSLTHQQVWDASQWSIGWQHDLR